VRSTGETCCARRSADRAQVSVSGRITRLSF
jgi:hypothetical protein